MEDYLDDKYLLYGSGEQARFIGYQQEIEDGVVYIFFLIEPNEPLIERYQLKVGEEIDAETNKIVKIYRKDDVFFLPEFGRSQMVIVDTDFEGNPTEYGQRHLIYKDMIKRLEERNDSLDIANHTITYENKKLMTRKTEYMKEIKELAEQLQMHRPKEKKEEDT